jgi:hypothetical protein
MSVKYTAEEATKVITKAIMDNFDEQAALVRADRGDDKVDIIKFKQTYNTDLYKATVAPSLFVMFDEFTYDSDRAQSNYVNAKAQGRVRVIIEGRNEQLLQLGVYRYEAILFAILNQANLTDGDKNYKLKTVVKRSSYSNLYIKKDEPSGVFRREVLLEIDCFNFENF